MTKNQTIDTTKATPSTRARITEMDARYLAFLAKFPAADAEALSYIQPVGKNTFGAKEGKLPEPSGIDKRFQKLIKLGAAAKYRNPITGKKQYGITALGHEAISYFGWNIPVWRGIDGLAISRLDHYRNIAVAAAKLTCPNGLFTQYGLNPIPLEQLISENEMRRPYETAKSYLKTRKENGETAPDFAIYRGEITKRAIEQVKNGEFNYSDIVTYYPLLLTIATIPTETNRTKPLYQHDLTIRLDDTNRNDNNQRGTNIIVEVELSVKTPAEYEAILRTIKKEIASGIAYDRAIYFTGTPGITNAIKRADHNAGTHLIETGKLHIIPIEGKVKDITRIEVPKSPTATVQTTNQLPELI